jgi:hypothetical protein
VTALHIVGAAYLIWHWWTSPADRYPEDPIVGTAVTILFAAVPLAFLWVVVEPDAR